MIRVLPAELLGYLTKVVPLAWVGSRVFERWPTAALTMNLLAATWVMYLAVKLWGFSIDLGPNNRVTGRRIYFTTLLNPKALIFGLVLLPDPADTQFVPSIVLLSLSAAAVAIIWGSAGALMQVGRAGSNRMNIAQRTASIWLAIDSLTLLASSFGG